MRNTAGMLSGVGGGLLEELLIRIRKLGGVSYGASPRESSSHQPLPCAPGLAFPLRPASLRGVSAAAPYLRCRGIVGERGRVGVVRARGRVRGARSRAVSVTSVGRSIESGLADVMRGDARRCLDGRRSDRIGLWLDNCCGCWGCCGRAVVVDEMPIQDVRSLPSQGCVCSVGLSPRAFAQYFRPSGAYARCMFSV